MIYRRLKTVLKFYSVKTRLLAFYIFTATFRFAS